MEFLKVFILGGLFCAIGQFLIDKTRLTPGKILVCYVVAGVFLTAVGVYQPLVDWGGAGATVPLTGFGYALANGVKESMAEHGWFGAISGGLTGTAAGITAAIMVGYLAALLSRPKEKG